MHACVVSVEEREVAIYILVYPGIELQNVTTYVTDHEYTAPCDWTGEAAGLT